jgi:hypothetical protein
MAVIAALDKYKTHATGFGAPCGPEIVEIEYDFAKDGGAVGQYDIIKAKEKCHIRLAALKIDTTCTSGGAATVGVGKSGDLAGVVAATAVASLVADAVILGATPDASHVMAVDDVLYLDIATAALTAGKLRVTLEIFKF